MGNQLDKRYRFSEFSFKIGARFNTTFGQDGDITPLGLVTMSAIEEVRQAAATLVTNFGAGRVPQYFGCFSADADFIFYTHNEHLTSRVAYEELWKSWEAEINFKVLSCTSSDQHIRLLSPTAAVFTHNVSTTVSTTDGTDVVLERETIVFELINGSWIAVHEHLSPMPANS
jgi:SnoaL-like domain